MWAHWLLTLRLQKMSISRVKGCRERVLAFQGDRYGVCDGVCIRPTAQHSSVRGDVEFSQTQRWLCKHAFILAMRQWPVAGHETKCRVAAACTRSAEGELEG